MSLRWRGLVSFVFLFVAGSAWAQASPRTQVVEGAERRRAADDPAMNPSSPTTPPDLPVAALGGSGPREPAERERGTWAAARWTTSTLQLPGNAKKTTSVARASTLMIRASWPGPADLTISIRRGNATLKSVKGKAKRGVGRLATALVRVPAAGNVVITVTGPGSSKVTLHIGVLAAQ